MAALAGLLVEAGERVSGVDSALYPPTSELLAELGVPVRLGYDPARIPPDCDRVIIGNAVGAHNVEVQAVLQQGLPYTSQAAAFGERFCRAANSVVVTGTHGKTTTTALAAHLLTAGGLDPTVMIGGVPRGGKPWRLGHGGWTVVEGDEYNTAFFDRGPKFLHYYPHLFVIGNVEFDHGDIYADLGAIMAAFRAGVAEVPPTGLVVANAGDAGAREVARGHQRVVWYGCDAGANLRCRSWTSAERGLRAELEWDGQAFAVETPLVGRHNLDNLLAACTCALLAGLAPAALARATRTFPGVRRRLELLGEEAGIAVVDDFAHHPTAVLLTLEGARTRFPGRRLVVAFEPRSLTAGRALFASHYVKALAAADCAVIAPVFHRQRLAPGELLDREALARKVEACGGRALMVPDGEDPLPHLLRVLGAGDVVVCMSSGDFGGLPRRLLESLRGRG